MVRNPFKPTAGKTPPALIGRDYVIEEFLEGIENGSGAPSRLMRITGVRGMGKTVMLNEVSSRARDMGWSVIDETASEGLCERIIAAAMPQHMTGVTINPSALGASLGSLDIDRAALTLRQALSHAIDANGYGLLITLDEVQDAPLEQMRALAIAIQHEIREDKDIAFVFAGLPSMVENVVNGKTLTFLRRAVPVELCPVGISEVASSFCSIMAGSGVSIDKDTAAELAVLTQGYPFMVQLVGYYVWQLAVRRGSGVVSKAIATDGASVARERFELTVIEPALQRLAPSLIEYLLAMAQDGGSSCETGEVARRMGKTAQQVSSYRSRLIDDDVIESAGWGMVSFAIPYMAEYLNDNRDQIETKLLHKR